MCLLAVKPPRRLYDVANVLVSIGLIEKLRVSTSRKPVFRWRERSASESLNADRVESSADADEGTGTAMDTGEEQECHIKEEVIAATATHEDAPADLVTADSTVETLSPSSLISLKCEEDTGALKTSQSSDTDSIDGENDYQSDCSSANGSLKRQYAVVSAAPSDDESSAKRVRTEQTVESSPSLTSGANEDAAATTETTALLSPKLLRFEANQTPVHPQVILDEQHERVRVFMQQYIREYFDYLQAQQEQADPSTATHVAAGAALSGDSSGSGLADVTVAGITESIHGTPVTIPSLTTSRVMSDLAGSIHDVLFSASTTSPQSVSELILAESNATPAPSQDARSVRRQTSTDTSPVSRRVVQGSATGV